MFKLFGYSVFKKTSPLNKLASLAAKNLEVHLSDLNRHLSSNVWIGGDQFSLADITWMVILHRLEEIQLFDKFSFNKKKLNDYYNNLKRRESFVECILNFNHHSIETGIRRLKKEMLKNKNLTSYYSTI